MKHFELITETRARLGEGPIWDDQQQHLLWVDIYGQAIYATDVINGRHQTYNIGQLVGTIVPWRNQEVLLAVQNGIASFHLETGQLTLLIDPEADVPDNRFNDGKCDPAGRFWAGTMALENPTNQGALYCIDIDLTVKKMVTNVGISNGIVWSLDHRTMYYIDSMARTVRAYDFDIDSGHIANERVAIDVPEAMGVPDGMAIDADGMLWIAHFAGGRVCRWHPKTGVLLQTIQLPVSRITACAFGGSALDTLYITTASLGVDLADEPLAGRLFAVQPGVKGVPAHRFGG